MPAFAHNRPHHQWLLNFLTSFSVPPLPPSSSRLCTFFFHSLFLFFRGTHLYHSLVNTHLPQSDGHTNIVEHRKIKRPFRSYIVDRANTRIAESPHQTRPPQRTACTAPSRSTRGRQKGTCFSLFFGFVSVPHAPRYFLGRLASSPSFFFSCHILLF